MKYMKYEMDEIYETCEIHEMDELFLKALNLEYLRYNFL